MVVDAAETRSTGPILSDGTALRDLIDTDQREVSMRLFADQEVFELELERLWARCWLFLAHESEIPEPGDYVLRNMATDPVLVVRGDEGQIEVLLNVCSHRGMQVCRSEYGNAQRFTCAYHGWIFGRDGTLRGTPFEREFYGDSLDKDALGLPRARVEERWGLVFATWDPRTPSLEEFLGDIVWYLDTVFNRTSDGIEVVGAPQRYVIPANWKAGSEQFVGADGYHPLTLHRSLGELAARPGRNATDAGSALNGVDISTPQGHGLRCVDQRGRYEEAEESPWKVLEDDPPPGLPAELVPRLKDRLNDAQIRVLAKCAPAAGGLFPNFAWVCAKGPSPEGGATGAALGLHTFVPRGPRHMEMVNWNFVERAASAEYKRITTMTSVFNLGVSGIIEQDDEEAWPAMQRSANGFMGRQRTLKYQALLGENKPDDWEGGGLVYAGTTMDDGQWNMWLRYLEIMTGGDL